MAPVLLFSLLGGVGAVAADGALNLERVAHSNLGGKGPMQGAEVLRYARAIEVGGTALDMVISSDGVYMPVDPYMNGALQQGRSVGVINLKVGTSANLTVSFVEPGSGRRVSVPKFFFSVFDLEQRTEGEEERLKISGPNAIYLTDVTRLEYKHEVHGTYFKPIGSVAVRDPNNALVLSTEQRAHTVTFLFRDTSRFHLSVECTAPSESEEGWNFLFGSASNAPSYSQFIPMSYLEDTQGKGWQSRRDWLKRLSGIEDEDDTDARSDAPGVVGSGTFREPDPNYCSCNLDLTHVKINNLGGLGPEKDGLGHMLRYGAVCTLDGQSVDLVIEDTGGYRSTDVQGNGVSSCGPYGSISVKFGTMVSLQARFVDAETNAPVRMKDFFFSVFDMDLHGSHAEKVTIHDLWKQYQSPRTVISQEEIMTGSVFKSPSIVSGVDCPRDPLALTAKQAAVAVTALFQGVSQFRFNLEVMGSEVERSHTFLFGGTSSINPDCSGLGPPTSTTTSTATTMSTTTSSQTGTTATTSTSTTASDTSTTSTFTATTTFDCREGSSSGDWSEKEQDSCCRLDEKYCTTTTTTATLTTVTTKPEPFNCSDLAPRNWSSEKQGWCCNRYEKGCEALAARGSHAVSTSTFTTTLYMGCGKAVACELKLTSVIHDNLSGKGPDKIEPQNLRYGRVCTTEQQGAVDLVITAESSYVPFDSSDNGKSTLGPYGSINVRLGSSVHLRAAFMHAGTNSPAEVESVFFSVFGLGQQSPAHQEVVTVRSFDSFHVSSDSIVDHVSISNGAVFKSTSQGAFRPVARDPLNCTADQEAITASAFFRKVSEFTFTLCVEGEPVEGGRSFLFGGRSCVTEHCSTTTTTRGTTSTIEAKYHCSAGDQTSWPGAQRAWCCEHRSVACADPYDCEAGYVSWQLAWSTVKKSWCCMHEGRGCSTTTTWRPDCRVTVLTADAADWCCKHEHVACPTTTSTPVDRDYDCDVAFRNWRHAWSDSKMDWCCVHERRGCKFDCSAAYHNREAAWSDGKKEWCCRIEQRGCSDDHIDSTMSEQYVCVGHDESRWTPAKQAWCCQHEKKGCSWVPFNCSTHLDSWRFSWSHPKRQWCCSNYGRGCEGTTPEPFDCTDGFETWQDSWDGPKLKWCCRNYNRGCTSILRRFADDVHVKDRLDHTIPEYALACAGVLGLSSALLIHFRRRRQLGSTSCRQSRVTGWRSAAYSVLGQSDTGADDWPNAARGLVEFD